MAKRHSSKPKPTTGIGEPHVALDPRVERAQRAVARFRPMVPMLTGFARMITRDKNVRVQMAPTSPMTDGQTIFLRPPIELGDNVRHVRTDCDVRDIYGPVCPACKHSENIIMGLYHEISHIAFDSFAAVSDSDKAKVITQAIAEMGGDDATRAGKIRSRIDEVWESFDKSDAELSYIMVANFVSPFLPMLVNAIEDWRVNTAMQKARPGTRTAFGSRYRKSMELGITEIDGSVWFWHDRPVNSQVIIGILLRLCDYEWYKTTLDAAVVECIDSEEVTDAIGDKKLNRSSRDSFFMAVRVLEAVRKHGFLLAPDDPEDESEPEPEPKESDDAETSDDTGSDDTGSDDTGSDDTGSDTGSEPEPAGDASEPAGDDTGSDTGTEPEPAGDDTGSDTGTEPEPAGDDTGSEPEPEPDDSEAGDGEPGAEDGDTDEPADDDAEGESDGDASDDDEGAGQGDGDSEDADGDTDDDFEGSGTSESDGGDDDGSAQSDEMMGSGDGNVAGEDSDDELSLQVTEEEMEEMGDPASVGDDLDKFLGHDSKGFPEDPQPADDHGAGESAWGEPDEPEDEHNIDTAIVQQEHFDRPATGVAGVQIVTDKNPMVGPYARSYNPLARGNEEYYRQNMTIAGEPILGPALMHLRVAFAENKKRKKERNLKTGRVNSRTLGRRAATGDERLFYKPTVPGKRSYFVVIGMDLSGSTSGRAIHLIKSAALAQAELCQRLGVAFAVYGHTGAPSTDDSAQCDLIMVEVKSADEPWDTKVKDRLMRLGSSAANLDGHSLEFYRKLCDRRTETDKVIMYYSDGSMPAENYYEELEVLQHNIKLCDRRKYTVMCVGVGTDAPEEHGLQTCRIDTIEQVRDVVKYLASRLNTA
jgi:hypothetical protein